MSEGKTGSQEPGTWRNLVNRGLLAWRLMGDRRVPLLLKGLPLFALLYLISPIDLAPMLAMGPLAPLGALDDLTIALLGLYAFTSLAPPDVVAEYERKMTKEGWRVEDDAPGDGTPPMVEGFYRIVDDDES